MTQTSSRATSSRELTAEQTAKALHYLAETRAVLVSSVSGLSDAQLAFKPAADRWSIEETLEHIVLIEDAIHGIISHIGDSPEAPPDWQPAAMDEFIPLEVPRRSTRIKAPEQVCPTHRWCAAEALQRFIEGRERTMQLASTPGLRRHIRQHPVLGPWDGYHWLLAAAAHSARHTAQIEEVKTEPDFPAA